MPTLLKVYHQLCTEDRLPDNRRKDILTALRYLAASSDTTPEQCSLTPEVEATYRQRLRRLLLAQRKGPSTIRNAIQGIGQYLKAYHQMDQSPIIPIVRPHAIGLEAARREAYRTSPYYPRAWLAESHYVKPLDQFSPAIREPMEDFRQRHRTHVRAKTIALQLRRLRGVLSYLAMSPETRLSYLPPEARHKLTLKAYREDLQTITETPILQTIDDLFRVPSCDSFMVWHSWRVHTPEEAAIRDRPPSKPTTTAAQSMAAIYTAAKVLGHPEEKAIFYYSKQLNAPRKLHDKGADYHTFSFADIERIAKDIIDEAPLIQPMPSHWSRKSTRPGAFGSVRFQVGLILMMGWRCPLRVRNWCEMLIDTNLKQVNGGYLVHFEGEELKIGKRGRDANIFELAVAPEVLPYLEEFLSTWRPRLDPDGHERHVFLTMKGTPLAPSNLGSQLKAHVYRHTGRLFFPHLLRTIFTSEMLSAGVDINSVAYGLGDQPATVLRSYNELQAGRHQQSLQDAYRRALNGHGKGTSR